MGSCALFASTRLFAAGAIGIGCGSTGGGWVEPSAAAALERSPASSDDFVDAPTWTEHPLSRQGLTLSLPDGYSWKVLDRGHGSVKMIHAGSRSQLSFRVWRSSPRASAESCEAEYLRGGGEPAPAGGGDPIDREVISIAGFDSVTQVIILPPQLPEGPALGQVRAFGGAIRRCLAVIFHSRAEPSELAQLASRLAFVTHQILPRVRLHRIEQRVGREPGL